jgi:hypothetical protein
MGPFSLGDGTFDGDLLISKSVFEPLVIVSMVPWVRKFLGCCGGSWTCGGGGGGGGLVSVLTWLALVLLGVG